MNLRPTCSAPVMREKPARFTRTFSSGLLLEPNEALCEKATGSNERTMMLTIWKEWNMSQFNVSLWWRSQENDVEDIFMRHTWHFSQIRTLMAVVSAESFQLHIRSASSSKDRRNFPDASIICMMRIGNRTKVIGHDKVGELFVRARHCMMLMKIGKRVGSKHISRFMGRWASSEANIC